MVPTESSEFPGDDDPAGVAGVVAVVFVKIAASGEVGERPRSSVHS